MTTDEILDILEEMFPDAHCELEHRNAFELLVAVVLSAQTTDAAVNKVTQIYMTLRIRFAESACTATRRALFRTSADHCWNPLTALCRKA